MSYTCVKRLVRQFSSFFRARGATKTEAPVDNGVHRPPKVSVPARRPEVRQSTNDEQNEQVNKTAKTTRQAKTEQIKGAFKFCSQKFTFHTPSYQFPDETNVLERRFVASRMLSCRIPPPTGYTTPVRWPMSKTKVWLSNLGGAKDLEKMKGGQNWLRVRDKFVHFDGGGTHFRKGAAEYLRFLGSAVPLSSSLIRTALDMGAGVASFGADLLTYGILTLSYAPHDQHSFQIQCALERGIPAMLAALQRTRLPLPSASFDLIHCSRCRQVGPDKLAEIDRLLRPGGYVVESRSSESVTVNALIEELCWKKIFSKRRQGHTTIYQKSKTPCRRRSEKYPLCTEKYGAETEALKDTPWGQQFGSCRFTTANIQRHPTSIQMPSIRDVGAAHGQLPAHPKVIEKNMKAELALTKTHLNYYRDYGFSASSAGASGLRNVMDMNAGFGSFAAILEDDKVPVWVMNVVPIEAPNTLQHVYDRGLIGIYHDWCQDAPTYPRTYDAVRMENFSSMKFVERCGLVSVVLEVDRILRPGGLFLFSDHASMYGALQPIMLALGFKANGVQNVSSAEHDQMLAVWQKKAV
ncbi:hypothetical protein CYMTET_53551 [Cymbomonas tetramitiformis]|uniref:Methyltransferase n=1 Tax=Cymbomonas tetramitiformis TaxID=36881 RepID=A0AAE0BGZ4_9CHLO|nr:hypothetical protein CYMTET_53551 [Cymbomonas tetramitiformis]